MNATLENLHGNVFVVRAPAPVNVNKAGANYKSEVAHLEYSPRKAYDEWLSICEGIAAFGGDAIFHFEDEDEPFLDRARLRVDGDGTIFPEDSKSAIGSIDRVLTGRVFTANGPWVVREEQTLRALLPNMLEHRTAEEHYYRRLLEDVSRSIACDLSIARNPHRWEGMADVSAVAGRVVLTYTVEGHYDFGIAKKSMRSSREGVRHAADFAGLEEADRIYVELVYPHFHGDTVHVSVRPPDGAERLLHYSGGLWGDGATHLRRELGGECILPIDRQDAVDAYAGNARQVGRGVLVPSDVSATFVRMLDTLGLEHRRIPLSELFGKAGGGPGCATLYLPKNLGLPDDAPMRFSSRRREAHARRERIAERLLVDRAFFEGRARG